MKLPDCISTEYGKTFVIQVSSLSAVKFYTCPLCRTEIGVGEAHVALVPEHYEKARRHVHSDCLLLFIENNFTIRLHPKSTDLIPKEF